MRICSFEECRNKHDSHGYCANHARQYRKFGHPLSKEEKHKHQSEASKKRLAKYYAGNPDRPKRSWSAEKREAAKGVCKNTGRTHFKKGYKSWNTGLKNWISEEHKELLKKANKEKRPWNKGLWGYNAGEKNPNWKGGAHTKNNALRRTKRYQHWRTAVFDRDDYTCQMCSLRGVYLEADHIKPFAFFPELRFEINNGRTLCKECHMQTPTYKKHKYMEVTS